MRRRANPQRFRKTIEANLPDHDARSVTLRTVRDLLQRRRFAEALTQIDQQVAATSDTGFKSRLLSLAADCLFKQGKFSDATAAYNRVSQLAQNQPLAWLRPALGEVRSLLKDAQVDAAQNRAVAAVQAAVTFEQQYQTQLAQVNATLATGGQALVPAQPPRPAGVANRLGKQFFAEGELAAAKVLFAQALQLSPNSAQARLGLAEIALRENNAAQAKTLAREAIMLGVYRAKTLPAWNLLLAAGRKLGTDALDTPLLNGLAQAVPSVRARAVLLLAKGLRNQGDARWQQIAANWLQQAGASNPKIAAEFRKLKFTHTRLTNAPLTDQLQTAQQLLQTPNLSPTEWLSGAKEVVRTSLLLNQTPAIDAMITQAVNRFGQTKQAAFTGSRYGRGNRAMQRKPVRLLIGCSSPSARIGKWRGKQGWLPVPCVSRRAWI